MKWAQKPFVYQINTYVWLNSLSRKYGYLMTLDNVPDEVLDALAGLNLDVVWLMGVWMRSSAARQTALNYKEYWRPALSDMVDDDVIASPYAIYGYEAEPAFGGRDALATIRKRLRERNLMLMLDYVPNHLATDHPWTQQHPDCFVCGKKEDLKDGIFFSAGDQILAHGRDPYFPPWTDTAQVNAFHPVYRQQAVSILRDIASQCDGVRCDMAMLLLNRIFAQTWKHYVGEPPENEFWVEIISQVKSTHPDFLFAAEAYWGLEYALQEQGFDFTYDKLLYDHIVAGDINKIQTDLSAPLEYQKRTVRFIENHDEPRAAEHIGVEKSRAAAVLIATLPGMTLLHDGQFVGRRVKLPVQVGRQPDEPEDEALRAFYHLLLAETHALVYQEGNWQLFEAFPVKGGVEREHHLLTYGWHSIAEDRLIVLNLTGEVAEGVINLGGWDHLPGYAWKLQDVLGSTHGHYDGDALMKHGLEITLPPYSAHLYRCERR